MDIDIDAHQPHPPPKPPHFIISPMTDLANNFRNLSSSSSSDKSNSSMDTTPNRGKAILPFNLSTTSEESINAKQQQQNHIDLGVDIQPPKVYTSTEAETVLKTAHTADHQRFKRKAPFRRNLFTKHEQKFNILRRMNSCGTQSPRNDEKLIGRTQPASTGRIRQKSQTIDITSSSAGPTTSCSSDEHQTDKLFEISHRSRSYNRHRSDSSTPLRKSSNSIAMNIPKGTPIHEISPPCSPLRLPKTSSKNSSKLDDNEGNPADIENFDDFFERFSDDGLGMDDDEENNNNVFNPTSLPQSSNQPVTPLTTRHGVTKKNTKTLSPFAISPLLANMNSKSSQKFASPMSMKKLLTGDIKANPRRGLFKDNKPKLIPSPHCSRYKVFKQPVSPSTGPSRGRSSSRFLPSPKLTSSPKLISSPLLSKPKMRKSSSTIAFSPSPSRRKRTRKEFTSPHTPSKIRTRKRDVYAKSFNRAKSMTFTSSALRQIDPNLAGSRNYQTSANDHEILKRGLERMSSTENIYAGDHSKKLTLTSSFSDSRHPQLTNISSKALADLLSKPESPIKYEILDCRYPYEFNGGSIKSAINIHNEKQLCDRFFSPSKEEQQDEPLDYQMPPDDTILIFHCEFSSERAPKMIKAMREIDRKENIYPTLKFPELYLLKGGYKEFFGEYPEHCINGYVPMMDEAHTEDLESYRMMRKKSKTWTTGNRLAKDMKQKKKLF